MAKVEQRATSSERLLNRELSWLDFNARVLELAEDPSVPLLERVKFCSIFSSNLDEFFMVRVAGLMRQAGSNVPMRSVDGRSPRDALAQIRERALTLTERQAVLWTGELQSALAAEGILVGACADCTERRARRARRAVRSRALPGPYTARSRARTAVPVHLGPLAVTRAVRSRPRFRGGAVCADQGAGNASAVRSRRRERPAAARRRGHRALPAVALPGDGDRRACRLPRVA